MEMVYLGIYLVIGIKYIALQTLAKITKAVSRSNLIYPGSITK